VTVLTDLLVPTLDDLGRGADANAPWQIHGQMLTAGTVDASHGSLGAGLENRYGA
jgi:hypothetical protein